MATPKKVKGGIYMRGNTYWYRYRGKRGSLDIPAGMEGAKQAAQDAFGLKVKQLVDERLHGKPQAHTLRQLFDKYMAQRGSTTASSETTEYRRRTLEAFFGPTTLLSDIAPEDVIEFKAKRINEDGVVPSTANREINTLKATFNWGVKKLKWLPINPCAGIGPVKGEDVERHRPFSEDEEARLLEVAAPWLQELIVFLINTGLRSSECWRLQWPSVDFKQRVLTVENLDGGRHSKNGERRIIPLNETVLNILSNRLRSTQTRSVFYTAAHTPHDNANVRRAFLEVCKRAKVLENPRVYDLRHTFGTRMVQRGVDLYTVQVLMGHKSPKMTQRYAKHNVESLRRGVDALAVGQ